MKKCPSSLFEIYKFIIAFAKKYSVARNECTLPLISNKSLADESLCSVSFSSDGIGKIIKNYASNKAHVHMINICMVTFCDTGIGKILRAILENCLLRVTFFSEQKKLIKKDNSYSQRVTNKL